MTEANTIDLKLEKVLDRIRKLLNLAKGGATPEEAATAVAHAQKLMDEHHIEEAPNCDAAYACHSRYVTQRVPLVYRSQHCRPARRL